MKKEGNAISKKQDLSTLNYEYSNNLPKTKKIISKRIFQDCWSWVKRHRFNTTVNQSIKIIENVGYSLISGAIPLSQNAFAYLFIKGKEILFVLCYYNNKSCRLDLKKIYNDDNSFSWNHIGKFLLWKMNPRKPRDRHQPIRKLSKNDFSVLDIINERDTIKFIKRIAVVTNPKGSHNFYAIYDDEREKNKVKRIIENLFKEKINYY